MSKNETQTFRLTVSSHKNANVFRMTLFTLIYVTDTERNSQLTSEKLLQGIQGSSVHWQHWNYEQ